MATVRNYQAAIRWAAVWAISVAAFYYLSGIDSLWMLVITFPLWLISLAGPFIAIGSIFGRARAGLAIGLVFSGLFFLFALCVSSLANRGLRTSEANTRNRRSEESASAPIEVKQRPNP